MRQPPFDVELIVLGHMRTVAQRPAGRSGVANYTWGISEAISWPSVNVF